MKKILVAAVLIAALGSGCARPTRLLSGTGSTFVNPLMTRWGGEYEQAKGVKVEYESIGSGVGVQRLTAGTFDFACTDAPMTQQQLEAAKQTGGEVLHIPLVLGAVVPAYNLEKLKAPLTLDGSVLAGIYLGNIKKWNDEPIKKLNPDADLPSELIHVVHRDDASGTTYIWTDYLSKVSPEWKQQAGVGTSIDWPAGEGAAGNDGVSAKIKETPNSLGYLPLNYALKGDIAFALMKNKEGAAVQASLESVTAAADHALTDIPEDLRYSLTDAPGKDSYPISGSTWAVVFVKQAAGRGQPLVDFLRWATHDGQADAEELHYARLPQGLVARAEKKLDQIDVGK